MLRRPLALACLWLLLPASATLAKGPRPHYPPWWLRQAACISYAESRDQPTATGDGNYGLFQFAMGTWQSVGGSGDPRSASRAEQTYRAWLVWKRDGGSWREWSTAKGCGV